MSDRRAPFQHLSAITYEQLLEKVRYEGAYPTRERAEEAVRLVLAGLGRQLTGDERVELAARLLWKPHRPSAGRFRTSRP